MNIPTETSQLHALAGEFVLGTLQGQDRSDFEQEMRRDFRLQAEVDDWERRLYPLLEQITPVEPPHELWSKIEQSLGTENPGYKTGFWQSLAFWRGLGLAATTMALVLALQILNPQCEPFDRVMVVTNPLSEPGWVVSADSEEKKFNITTVKATPLQRGKFCQLWMEDAHGNLIPVGTMPHSGSKEILSPSEIPKDALFKVSIELEGRQPLQDISQEVIFAGKMVDM